MDAAMALPNRRVDVGFTGVAPQNRLTVLVRLILLIPQVIVLALLAIALFFVAIIGWFAALITGRLPEWARTFITGLIRWSIRVDAYYFLLTDRYPPFSFDDADYPVRAVFPAPGELNRLAVLFRFFIAIPATVFQQIVYYGLTLPLIFVTWLIVLVSGQMPQPLYTAYCALLRYQTRHGSYFFMLTSEYPWGMLGDVPAGARPPGAAPPPAMPQAPPEAPPAFAPAPPPPPTPDQPSDTGAPPVWPPPMPPPSEWERSVPAAGSGSEGSGWGTLIVAGAARGWMIFAIVWGSIIFLFENVLRR
jgi:Domain of unknown function (DUF4389)